MYRAGLLAVLLLTVVAAAGATLTCTVESSETVDTTNYISVSFKFESIAPVFPDKGIRFTDNLIYSPADSAQWDRQLEFKVTLEHYAPNQSWRIDTYKCVYNNSGNVEVRYYDVVAQTPQRKTTTITFTVPATAAEYSASTSVKVSQPFGDGYCSETPTVNSWPNCPAFEAEDNKVSVEYPSWQALQVNGYKPGDVVKAYGVNATIPDPWEYGIKSDDGKTLSYVEIDGGRYGPDVRDATVESSVYLYMVGMPMQWGKVKVKGAELPLYVVKPVVSQQFPTTFCRPPACIVLNWVNATTNCAGAWRIMYVSVVAVQSGITMKENVVFMLDHFNSPDLGTELRLPFGSVFKPVARVWWVLKGWNVKLDDPARFRVINDPAYYERIAENGKIDGPLFTAGWGFVSTSEIAVAVDRSAPSIELSWYARPLPYHTLQSEPLTVVNWFLYVNVCGTEGVPVVVDASTWIADTLTRNYPEISRNRRLDLLRYLYGEPVVYYWGSGDQHGTVRVRTTPYYAGTTADSAGQIKLYHTSGIAPTDATAMVIPSTPQSVGSRGGGGGGGGGGSDCVDCSVSYWLVSLVPTAACRSMFCTSLSPELLGPVPSFAGDRALPNMGYSIMLMYIGEAGRHRVKVYIEDGYVISSGPPINVTRAQNYKLVEIDKEWKPLEAVVVGPGWWVPLRQLDACGSMPIRASSIYTTPDRPGPVKVIVEDNGANSTYVFYVTNDVGYRITTRTPAPESITATPFNITAYITLGGVPYYHAAYGYGEGGRLSPPACASTWFNTYPASQLYVSGDFWGSLGLAHMPLKPVSIWYVYTRPRLELVEPWRGLVRVRADGPVSGFAFYAQRGGAWVKIGEAGGRCILVNASRIFPWDPILVLPLVGQELEAAPGSTVAIWRPETALLFKTWADLVGYPKGARSVLAVVGRC